MTSHSADISFAKAECTLASLRISIGGTHTINEYSVQHYSQLNIEAKCTPDDFY